MTMTIVAPEIPDREGNFKNNIMEIEMKYEIGGMIKNEAGLSLKVTDISSKRNETTGKNDVFYNTVCTKCYYVIEKTADRLEKLKVCPGCEEQPAALKTDEDGNCITICRMGQLEFIHRLITEEGMTQREAAELFVDAVKAHAIEGDPFTEDLTIDKVRSQFRRDSGKLKDKPKNAESWVGPTQGSTTDNEVLEKEKNKPAVDDERVTDKFLAAFNKMKEAVQKEREAGWSLMTKKTALRYANEIVNNIKQEAEQTSK